MDNKRSVKIISGIIIGVFLLVLLLSIFLNFPEDKFIFSFSDKMGLWKVSAGTMIQQKDGYVKLTKGPGDFFVVMPQINLNADYFDVCILEMELPIAYDQASFVFLSPDNAKKEKITLDFDTGKANRLNHLSISVSKHDDWHGIIRDIVLYPATNSDNVSLKSITFVRANPVTKLHAWWNDFTRYFDPLLGAVFGWPSPYFVADWFNPLVLPFILILLFITLLIIISVFIFRLDIRFSNVSIGIFFLILLLAWGMLDVGNNIYYIKAIRRNVSLYWGKDIWEKRSITTGNPEFIRFMKFCDDNIPMDGYIFNYVARDYLGSAEDALGATQFNFNLRTRVESLRLRAAGEMPRPYYVLYRYQEQEFKGKELEQSIADRDFVLQAKETLLQEIILQHYFEDIPYLSFKVKTNEIDPSDVSFLFLADDKRSVIGSGELLGVKNGEAIVRVIPQAFYRKSHIFFEIENRGKKPVYVGGSRSVTYKYGKCYFKGEKVKGDLAFRVDYDVKNLLLYKKLNEYAYILTK